KWIVVRFQDVFHSLPIVEQTFVKKPVPCMNLPAPFPIFLRKSLYIAGNLSPTCASSSPISHHQQPRIVHHEARPLLINSLAKFLINRFIMGFSSVRSTRR